MAITSSSQILNENSVINATAHLDDVISYLESAKSSLEYSLNYCGTDALNTNEGNTFPAKINTIISDIESQITSLGTLKTNILSSASSIHDRESREYQAYKNRMEEEAASDGPVAAEV